jgi:hypothetical protein
MAPLLVTNAESMLWVFHLSAKDVSDWCKYADQVGFLLLRANTVFCYGMYYMTFCNLKIYQVMSFVLTLS